MTFLLKIKRKVPKFVGKELIEQQMTKSEALQKTNNALEQKIKELRGEQNEGNEQTEQKKLTEFFSDKEYESHKNKTKDFKGKLCISADHKKEKKCLIRRLII